MKKVVLAACGMPDEWEKTHGLNPADASDSARYNLNPLYTNLEIYLNSRVEDCFPNDRKYFKAGPSEPAFFHTRAPVCWELRLSRLATKAQRAGS